MNTGSKEMLTGISFKTLQFVKPFTEIVECNNQHKGQKIFLKGIVKESGILVVRYVDTIGVVRYNFKAIEYCLINAARRVFEILTEKKFQKIEFALLPLIKRDHCAVLRALQNEYANVVQDTNFEVLKPWLVEGCVKRIPLNLLSFRRPFMPYNGHLRFSSYDYRNRGGLYVVIERHVRRNKIINAYVGKSDDVLASRMRSKFYLNPHLYYQEIPGVLEYYIAPIEIQRSMIPQGEVYEDALLVYEKRLINLLKPRDNKMGFTHLVTETIPLEKLVNLAKLKAYQNPF